MSKEELILDKVQITKRHFEIAHDRIKPHLSKEMLKEYTQMIRDFEVC
jgi:SpoVK/Ycf46/Vps4 family AAA+-type ATPase